MSDAMKPDEFAERFRNADLARADQAEAAKVARRDAEAMNEHMRTHAKAEVRQFEPIARDLVDRINAGSARLVMTPIANGFAVQCGREMASVYEVPPIYANVGVTSMVVRYTKMQSNLAAFGITGPEPENAREECYVPLWDTDANAIVWGREGGTSGVSTTALVQRIIETLQKRAA